MRHQPITLAFTIAILGAAAIQIRPGSAAGDWAAILVGAALSGAMTGIVASMTQFVPERLFVPSAIVGGMVVGFGVSALLYAAETIWLDPIAPSTVFVWAGAAIVTLLVTRASGVRLPSVRTSGAERRT